MLVMFVPLKREFVSFGRECLFEAALWQVLTVAFEASSVVGQCWDCSAVDLS